MIRLFEKWSVVYKGGWSSKSGPNPTRNMDLKCAQIFILNFMSKIKKLDINWDTYASREYHLNKNLNLLFAK